MSGRKSSEVCDVLKQGEAIRRMTDGTIDRQIENDLDEFRQFDSKIKALRSTSIAIDPSAEARKMFGGELEASIRDFDNLRAELRTIASSGGAEEIRHRLGELNSRLRSADAEAENIRRSIRDKDWYCDEEYDRAKALVRQYKQLREQRVRLQHDMTQIAQSTRQQSNRAQSIVNRMNDLKARLDNLNEVARKRQESDTMRRELRQMIAAIPMEWAGKFFEIEFAKLKSAVERAVADNDDNLIRDFQNICGEVTNFGNKLNARIEEWKNQKADAESWRDKVMSLADFQLIDPIEYYNRGEDGDKTELFAYIERYGGKDFRAEFKKHLDAATNALRNENFLESTAQFKEACDAVTAARDYATELQENMLKKTELAGAIQNVMSDLKYNIELSILNDNPNDGYRITCSIGDEVIDFDRVDIDGEGKVIVDVNHTEAIGGTCQNSWQNIARRLQDEGIPIMDVKTGDGRSVLRKPKKSASPASGVRVRG